MQMDELARIYQRFLDRDAVISACQTAEAADKMTRDICAPFLVKTNSEYENAKPRVVIVGQETNGWIDWIGSYADFLARGALNDALSEYESFDFGSKYNSTFFQYFDRIRDSIFGEHATRDKRQIILWLNLFKFFHGAMIHSTHREAVLSLQGNVFQEEIRLLRPDVIIFLTGPNYDWVIDRYYPNVQRVSIGIYSERQVAQLLHENLPSLSFRTYHPGYLNRFKKRTDLCLPKIIKRVSDAFPDSKYLCGNLTKCAKTS
jgi:hypothetical protein